MDRRLELHAFLVGLLGTEYVYFQPPASLKINYPCIVYSRDSADSKFANNEPYNVTKRYSVTVIDRNPDSEIPDKLLSVPRCLFSRHYTADMLHHDVFNLYF